MSPTTWGNFESNGAAVSALTCAGIARALEWPQDAIPRLLDGASPGDFEDEDNKEIPDLPPLAEDDPMNDVIINYNNREAAVPENVDRAVRELLRPYFTKDSGT